MEQSPDEILKRLEELRCWQGIQQEKLLSKQLSRSELCSMEQKKLCEMFGLSITSTFSNLSLTEFTQHQRPQTPIKNRNDIAILTQRNASVSEEQSDMDTSHVSQKHFRVETPINNFSLEELESYGKENENQLNNPDIDDKPKKSFLKRGQGLAARFKIDPEKLRIENLPKYKFANAHRKSKFFRDNKQLLETKQRQDVKVKQTIGEIKVTTQNTAKRDVIAVQKPQIKFIDDVRPQALNVVYGELNYEALQNKCFTLWTITYHSEFQITDLLLTKICRHQQHGLRFLNQSKRMLKSKPHPTKCLAHLQWQIKCKSSIKINVIFKSLSCWNKI